MHNLNKLGRGLLVDATHKDQDTVVADKNIFLCFPYLLLCKTCDPWVGLFMIQGV